MGRRGWPPSETEGGVLKYLFRVCDINWLDTSEARQITKLRRWMKPQLGVCISNGIGPGSGSLSEET